MVSLGLEVSSKSGIRELPEGWQWIALEKVCSHLFGGGTPKRNRPEYFGGDIVWITPTDLNINTPCQEVFDSKTKITQLGLESSSAKLVPAETVLFSTRATVGKIAIAGVPLCTNQGFANLVCNDHIYNRYLAWCLRSLTEKVKNLATSTTYLEVSRGKLRKFEIPIPFPNDPIRSLEIQHRIVTRIEALLGEVKRDRDLLQTMRKDADRFLAASVDEIFKHFEPVTKTVELGEIATAFNGRASGQGESNVRVFKTKHIYPHSLRMDRPSYMKEEQAEKLPSERYLQPGDVLMANIAEGTLGRVSYVSDCDESWTVDTQIMILRSKDPKVLDGKWLYYYLWSERGQHEILSRRSGIAFAEKRGQTHIYPKNVVEIPVPIPSIERQHQAVAHLDSILVELEGMEKIFNQDTKLIDQLEQSILEKAFRGEL